ncbi:unnamed protein product (macronuclear) [Paramecium tetraurelia]|uniref:Uncharacterized protein n=1 Tax=Paramecium tetraurelia TaxID=5888 RepID=A0DUN3_PARTE|nr:uncharacterized protein GSPATT00020422001 [Paramecium tetraurelia]CAK86750.1 unnamed protein product [Paramecium tetraurelia]|eukprot:XP_001454147.1 hypothetical protein (macronuclear) [Paramecium tetraurelia strain d4-2]
MDYEQNNYQAFDIEIVDTEQLRIDHARLSFIRKVFLIILFQIGFTFITTLIAYSQIPIIDSLCSRPLLFWIFIVVLILVIFLLMRFQKLAKQHPYNYICYSSFTLSISYLFFYTIHHYPTYSNHIISLITLQFGIIISLLAYSYFTASEINLNKGLTFILITIALLFIFLFLYFELSLKFLFILSFLIILYGVHIIIDTLLIVNGEKHELDIDDYIIAALMTQVDIIGLISILFQKLLSQISKIQINSN